MSLLLGIDGGGSKTFALVSDRRGELLGFGRAAGSNHQDVGLPLALQEIDRAASRALDAAGAVAEEVELAMCCLSGADFPEEQKMLQTGIGSLDLARRVEVVNDALAAFRSGASQPWGVVVICGTAFNAAGKAPDGRTLTLPAQGWISGDWGGGERIAREMVRLVMRADDGRGQPTLLTEIVLDALGQGSPSSLTRALYDGSISKKEVLHLVPLLFEAAQYGDRVARKLVVKAGTELGASAAAVIDRLGMNELSVEVVLGGSVFKGEGPLLLNTMRRIVRRTAPEAILVRPNSEPVVGAVMLGLEETAVEVDDVVSDKLRRSWPRMFSPALPVTGRKSRTRGLDP